MSSAISRRLMVCVAGRAGDGSYTTASVFAKALQRIGYFVHEQRDVYSNIRGKPSAFYVVVDSVPVYGLADDVDILVAFDNESLHEVLPRLCRGGTLIIDISRNNPTPKGQAIVLTPDDRAMLDARQAKILELPMAEMTRGIVKDVKMRNMIGLGVLAACGGISRPTIIKFIEKQFSGKKRGQEIIEQNMKLLDTGVEWARAQSVESAHTFRARKNPGRMYLLGDEAIAFGALAAGCRFFGGYPITPASEIFEYMMEHMAEFGGVAIQATSELEAITLVEGAAYAGARAMTATAGPGYSLMQEALSGAGCAETPLVIAVVQRGGPGTGLPTRTAQEDLFEVLFGGHGEFPRIVLSPSTPEECFLHGALAFNLAERYQCLVVVLLEQCVGQGRYTTEGMLPIDRVKIDRGKLFVQKDGEHTIESTVDFVRYNDSEDGISSRAIPGTPGITVLANSNEHVEEGFSTEDAAVRVMQVEKRMRKFATMRRDGFLPPPVFTGSKNARIGFLGYGGVLGPVLDAIDALNAQGIPSKFMRLQTLWPFPSDEVRAFVDLCDAVYIPEQNALAQLKCIVRMEVTGPDPRLRSILRFDGRPFSARDILQEVQR